MYRALANALREEISQIKRESKEEYLSISQKCRRRQWVDWLRHQAGTGNVDALAALRRRKPTRGVTVDSINGSVLHQRSASGLGHDGVTKQGRRKCGQGRGRHVPRLAWRGTGSDAGCLANGA
jgi:hypothetical protein